MDDIKQAKGRLPVQGFVAVLILVIVVVAIPLVILVRSGQAGGGALRAGAGPIQIPEKQKTDQEIVVSANRTTLYVPRGATDLTGSFVISPRQSNLFSYAGEPEWARPIVVDIQYVNDEGVNYPGITFSTPISVCFSLTGEQWTAFTQQHDNFQVHYFDSGQSPARWVSLPIMMDAQQNEICSQTDHLSVYALAIKATQIIPVTGATHTPTAIPTPTASPVFNFQEDTGESESEDGPGIPLPLPTNPPATNPPLPVTDPPATDPPATEPPAVTEEPEVPEPPAETQEPSGPGEPNNPPSNPGQPPDPPGGGGPPGGNPPGGGGGGGPPDDKPGGGGQPKDKPPKPKDKPPK